MYSPPHWIVKTFVSTKKPSYIELWPPDSRFLWPSLASLAPLHWPTGHKPQPWLDLFPPINQLLSVFHVLDLFVFIIVFRLASSVFLYLSLATTWLGKVVVVELGAKGQLVKQNVTFVLTQILKTLIVLENQIDFLSDSMVLVESPALCTWFVLFCSSLMLKLLLSWKGSKWNEFRGETG